MAPRSAAALSQYTRAARGRWYICASTLALLRGKSEKREKKKRGERRTNGGRTTGIITKEAARACVADCIKRWKLKRIETY